MTFLGGWVKVEWRLELFAKNIDFLIELFLVKGLFIIFTWRLCSYVHTNILSFVFMKTEVLSISNSTSACAKLYLHGKQILHRKFLKNAQFLHPPPSYFRLKIIADLIGTSDIEKKEPKIQVSFWKNWRWKDSFDLFFEWRYLRWVRGWAIKTSYDVIWT